MRGIFQLVFNSYTPMHNEQLSKISNIVIFSLLTFLVIFTPLAFGTVQPWSIFIFKLSVSLMLLAYLVKVHTERTISIRSVSLFIPLILFIAYVLIQLIPIPITLTNKFLPKTSAVYNVIGKFGINALKFSPISVDTFGTTSELGQFICYVIIVFISVNLIKERKNIDYFLIIILITGFAISFFGIIQRFNWSGKIYWFQETPANTLPFGPFVNYDHFGGYINMIIPIGLGFMLSDIESSKKTLVGFMTVIMAASLMLSRSRGAVLSFLAALILLLVILFILKNKYERKAFISMFISIVAVISFIVLFVYWIDWGLFIGRMKTIGLEGNFFDPRFEIWKDCLKMLKDFIITGVGYGNYKALFPQYQHAYADFFWRNAHNDYLQLIIEAGLPGILLVLVFIWILMRTLLKKILKSQNLYVIGLLVGGIVSMLTILLHSFVDFNSHITSNAFLLSLIIGLMISMTFLSRVSEDRGFMQFNLSTKSSLAVFITGFIFVLFVLIIPSTRSYLAYVYSEGNKNEISIKLDPNNSVYHHKLGLYYENQAVSEKDAKERIKLLGLSKKELEKAIVLSPTQSFYWASYGWLLGNIGQKDKGLDAMRRALELAPNRPQINGLFKQYLIQIYSRK